MTQRMVASQTKILGNIGLLVLDFPFRILQALDVLVVLAHTVDAPVEEASCHTKDAIPLSLVYRFLIAISLGGSADLTCAHQTVLILPIYIEELESSEGNDEE